jgi:hypothetical protein
MNDDTWCSAAQKRKVLSDAALPSELRVSLALSLRHDLFTQVNIFLLPQKFDNLLAWDHTVTTASFTTCSAELLRHRFSKVESNNEEWIWLHSRCDFIHICLCDNVDVRARACANELKMCASVCMIMILLFMQYNQSGIKHAQF